MIESQVTINIRQPTQINKGAKMARSHSEMVER
jgi:hypothetical protein